MASSSRLQQDSFIDDDDLTWYESSVCFLHLVDPANMYVARYVSKSSTSRIVTSSHVPVDIRYAFNTHT